MLSVRGIYTGNEIKPIEDIHMRPNVRVIITFLEDEPPEMQGRTKPQGFGVPPPNPTEIFLEKCGGWEDTRSPEEIIAEIYTSRTISERGTQLFQESL